MCLLYIIHISYFPKLVNKTCLCKKNQQKINKILLENNPSQSVRPYFVKSTSLLYNHARDEIQKSRRNVRG